MIRTQRKANRRRSVLRMPDRAVIPANANVARWRLASHAIAAHAMSGMLSVAADAVLVSSSGHKDLPLPSAANTASRVFYVTSRPSAELAGLKAAYYEAAKANWDGAGALAASRDSFSQARRLLARLPASFPAPEIGVDPDGEFSLDWIRDARHLLSVSVTPLGAINYGAVYGTAHAHGFEEPNERLLPELTKLLERLYADG